MGFKLFKEADGKTEYNAYTLFLILILLILSENMLIQLFRGKINKDKLSILPAPARKKTREQSEKTE